MQRKRIKTLIIVALSSVALVLGAFSVIYGKQPTVQAQTVEVSDVMENEIPLNAEVEVPSSIQVQFNGSHTAKNGVVVFPDGKIVCAGKIKFNQAGEYELRYFFDYLNVTHTAVQKIEVYSSYFNLSNPAGGEIIVSDEENQLYTKKDGVIVNLKSGTSFVYNKVLDLRDCGEDGLTDIIEIDTRYGHFDEEGNYVRDVQEGWIRLTDCYNPNIYIDLRMQNSDLYTGCLFPGVKTNSQLVTGMDKGVTQVLGSSRIITLDGINYRVWMGEGSMNVGMYNMKTELSTGCVWKYDVNTKRVYLTYNNKENFLVSDLDEPLIYTSGNLFAGFTTGEVYVSVFANGYNTTYARTEIISIGKDNLKEVSDKQCSDNVAPVIVVEKQKTTPTGVYGAIGDSVTIPSARAIDVNLAGSIDVAVYRGYGTETQLNVSVENNKFLLSEKDVYTIVYTAKDKNGNQGEEIFTVSAINTPDNRAVTLETVQSGTVSAGERIDNLFEVSNAINVNSEDVKVKVLIESENQNLVLEDENFFFTPYYEGDYIVKYIYSDGVFDYEKTVNLYCERSSAVCFMDEVVAPKYLVQGNTYAIDNLTAYSFTKGYPEATETKIYAVFDGGAEEEITNPESVQITGRSSVYFVYRASNGISLTTEESAIINTDYYKNGNKSGYDMSKFFIGDFTANPLNAYGSRGQNITFTSNKNEGNNKLSYFNRVSGRNFALTYKVVSQKANFASLKVILTDAKDENNKLLVEFFNNQDATYYAINNGALTKAELIKFEDSNVNITYDYESKFLRIGSYSTIVEFDASLVYVDVEMVGIKGESSIIIAKINNQTISGTSYTDRTQPEIYVQDFQGDYREGDIIRINQAEISDVVSGVDYSQSQLLITCSDGKPVLDKDGKVIDNVIFGGEYEILLDRIAMYYAIYEVYDFSGNKTTKIITLNCADTTVPTIELGNIREDYLITVKAGTEINFEFTVSDNVSKAKAIIVYIHLYCDDMFSFVPNASNIQPNSAPEDGKYSEKFTIHVKGNYTAQIHAIDEVGNVCVKYVKIIAE